MKKKKKVLNASRPTQGVVTSSRGVVEAVIDIVKDDKSSTWEQSMRHSKIARWNDLAKIVPSNL